MPLGIPPHLISLVVIAAIVVFFLLLRYFRRNEDARQFVGEILGDDTPERALEDFADARERLVCFRAEVRDPVMLSRIDDALAIGGHAEKTRV